MRQTIQRWHVGQLLMVWVVGLGLALVIGWVGSVAFDIQADRVRSAGFRADAMRRLARDSLLRADTAGYRVLRDTLAKVWAVDRPRAEKMAVERGLFVRGERDDARAVLAIYQPTSTTLPTAVGLLSWGAVLALLVGLWWATWVWFAGRARPAPPPSTG